MEVVHLHLQLLILGAQALGIGQQPGAVRGQPDAGPVPLQEGDIPFLLQVVDHPTDAGLGVVQHLRRPGEGAVFHGLDKSHVLQNIHIHSASLLMYAFSAC